MTLATGDFRLERRIATTPARLWHLITDPDARRQWNAPTEEDVLDLVQGDLREGGREVHRCGPEEEPAYTIETIWYRLDAPALACFSETVDAGGARIATSLVTYGLAEAGDGTTLSVQVHVSSFVGEEALADFETGWTTALARLETLVRETR